MVEVVLQQLLVSLKCKLGSANVLVGLGTVKSGPQIAWLTLELLLMTSPLENLSVIIFDLLLSEGRRECND